MTQYCVTYKLEVEGEITVEAASEDQAEEMIVDYDLSKLLDNAKSEDVEVTDVQEVKPSKKAK